MNKKRDSELAKLRKLLEDVHLESEENSHHLRSKHQAAIAEMQDQVDQLQKAKNKLVQIYNWQSIESIKMAKRQKKC